MDFWRDSLNSFLLVGLGGSLGAMLRYAVKIALPSDAGSWPWATWVVNVVGAMLIAAFYSYAERVQLAPWLAIFVVTGVLGGFTTFSTFTLEVMQAVERGAWWWAASVILGNLLACLGGFALVRGLVGAYA